MNFPQYNFYIIIIIIIIFFTFVSTATLQWNLTSHVY